MAEQQQQEQKKETALAAWQGFVDLAVIQNPTLKDKLTLAAASQMMALPDTSFGWSVSGAMPREAKALAVLAHLKYDLIPGSGAVFFLGNALYMSAAARRQLANTGRYGFKWLTPRVARPLTDDEKEMLAWEQGDRALAVDCQIEVNGEKMAVTGYAIVEKAKLGNPFMATKSNAYQTLFTRAERDILKRYLSLETPEAPDADEIIDAQVVGEGQPYVDPAAGRRAEQEEQEKREAFKRFMAAAKTIGIRRMKAIGVSVDEAMAWDAAKLQAATEAIEDERRKVEAEKAAEKAKDEPAAAADPQPAAAPEAKQPDPPPTAKEEPKKEPTAGAVPGPAYLTVDRWAGKMKAREHRELLLALGREPLFDEDASAISGACQMILDGEENDGLDRLSTLLEARRMPM